MITIESLKPHDSHNMRAILSVFALWGIPENMLEVGSGSGAITTTARALGVNAVGLDRLAYAPDIAHNLNNPINIGRKFDLVVTIETAEHIENEKNFLDIIDTHLAKGGTLVFTAALPGQDGDGHINCQPANHWRGKLYERGITYDNYMTAYLALMWAHTTGGLSAWLVPNLQVFKR